MWVYKCLYARARVWFYGGVSAYIMELLKEVSALSSPEDDVYSSTWNVAYGMSDTTKTLNNVQSDIDIISKVVYQTFRE
jgi:hypothetical protein